MILQLRQKFQAFPKKHRILLACLAALVFFALLMPSSPDASRANIPLSINEQLPETPNPAEQPKSQEPSYNWTKEIVKSGESLASIFQRAKIPSQVLYNIINNSEDGKQLVLLKPGQELHFAFDDNQQLMLMQYIPSRLKQIDFVRQDNGDFASSKIKKLPIIQLRYSTATINDSLFLAGHKAGLSENMIMQVADIFSGVIDFVHDPRAGDTFSVLYEEKFLDGQKIGNGNILFASYHGRSDDYQAYRFQTDDGKYGYYDQNGVSMQKAFLRAPLDFTRISSNFNPKRRHPLFNTLRPHQGIDYAAPTGTPVYAAGDGRVIASRYNKANGNYIFIQHGTKYETKYLHLSKRYVKAGDSVKQRQIIGLVGATGWATGPHLHYEFLVSGVHKNPRTIVGKLPSSEPITGNELARFEKHKQSLASQLNYQQQLLAKK